MSRTERITEQELYRRLANLDIPEKQLAPYFLDLSGTDEERPPGRQRVMGPHLALNPDTVQLPDDPQARQARSEAAMTFANRISRMRRRARFDRRIAQGYEGPVIVSEGDSWFQFPLLLEDVIDHLSDAGLAIRSLDAAGDTLDDMLKQAEILPALRETGAGILLLSAGGNDALGGGNLYRHLRDFDPVLPAAGYLLPSFQQLLDHTLAMYERVLRAVEPVAGVVTVCHGYDRPIPNGGRWLGQPMQRRGISDAALQRAVAQQMIDRFNSGLSRLLAGFGERAVFVDVRGAVGDTLASWYDELHPRDAGYGRVAERFRLAIDRVATRNGPQAMANRSGTRDLAQHRGSADRASESAPAPTPADALPASPRGRRGLSLHVGLNLVDPAHYGGNGQLFACHFDAQDMHAIARARGFEGEAPLLDGAATRQQVLSRLAQAADTLRAGDTLLFSYAGHGSQLPDFNRDEEDAADETLCLYDGMVIDDELYALWARFREGVRVVMLSDSCHSGSVLRSLRRGPGAAALPLPGTAVHPGKRLLPIDLASHALRQHRSFYRDLEQAHAHHTDEGLLLRELDMPLHCALLLVSGCQDNQLSSDGVGNGRFTQELLRVWNEGRFSGSWRQLHRQVVANMPPDQTPNLMLLGPDSGLLAEAQPFAV